MSPASADFESEQELERNDRAHVASKLGIVGMVLLAGAIALAVNTLITALTTPDFMPDDSDDPFAATCVACVLPFLVGCIGLIYGITALRVSSVLGGRRVAIRGLVFGILNLVFSITIWVVFFNFDLASAACGGG